MQKLTVSLGERSYDIEFQPLSQLGRTCRSAGLSGRCAIVTNPTVSELYLSAALSSLQEADIPAVVVTVPDGEEHKNLSTLERIYAALIEAEIDRNSFIVALGGGVVGDMAGFAAATFLRGIPFVQVPTTLLAQVDSSVGGKTGVNHPLGKNLIGAFYQPSAVLMDVATLSTLTDRDYRSGIAEVLKYAAVLDGSLFTLLQAKRTEVEARDEAVLMEVVRRCCTIKAGIVAKDEREGGLRAVLNYGHTLGHAVEKLAGYGEYTHGEAVAAGMAAAARISRQLGFCSEADASAIIELVESYGLPTQLPAYTKEEYRQVLTRDKKVRDGRLTFICNRGIGNYEFLKNADVDELLAICGIGG